MFVCLGLSRLFFYFVFVFANLASALPCFVVVLMAEEAVDMKTQIDASVAEDQASKAQFLVEFWCQTCSIAICFSSTSTGLFGFGSCFRFA